MWIKQTLKCRTVWMSPVWRFLCFFHVPCEPVMFSTSSTGWPRFPLAHNTASSFTYPMRWFGLHKNSSSSFLLGSVPFILWAPLHWKLPSEIQTGPSGCHITHCLVLEKCLEKPSAPNPFYCHTSATGRAQAAPALSKQLQPEHSFVVISAQEWWELASFPVTERLGIFYDLHALLLRSCTVRAAWLQETEDLFWLAETTFAVSLYNFTVWLVNPLPLLITSHLISWVQTSFTVAWIRLLVECIYQQNGRHLNQGSLYLSCTDQSAGSCRQTVAVDSLSLQGWSVTCRPVTLELSFYFTVFFSSLRALLECVVIC